MTWKRTLVPVLLLTGENDQVDPDPVLDFYHELQERADPMNPAAQPDFCLNREKFVSDARFARIGMSPLEVAALRTHLETSGLITPGSSLLTIGLGAGAVQCIYVTAFFAGDVAARQTNGSAWPAFTNCT